MLLDSFINDAGKPLNGFIFPDRADSVFTTKAANVPEKTGLNSSIAPPVR